MKEDLKIDLVYLWVDGNDLNWQKEQAQWCERLNVPPHSAAIDDCRFIDNQELKYSLRSVEMNAPWINKIFIVTNGQIPQWLDTTHPKINIVTHNEIMPQDTLPTFNSEAIETCLANIPELSEYFLYANDDMFINNPVTPDYFFDKNGEPILMLAKNKWKDHEIETSLFYSNIVYTNKLIGNKYGKNFNLVSRHNIESYRKSYLQACHNEFKEEFEFTKRNKFRTKNSVQRIIYTLWQLANVNSTIHANSKDQILQPLCEPNEMKRRLNKYKPALICINDCAQTNNENRQMLKNFLETIYYQKAPWEKD